MAHESYSERLATLIDAVFGGSANAAAIAAGVEPSTLHRLLNKHVSDPRMSTIQTLADAYGVPVMWLTGTLSTEEAQHGAPMPESYWLIRSYHRASQRDARALLLRHCAERPASAVAEAFAKFELMPSAPAFPIPAVVTLLSAFPDNHQERVRIERAFAELETDLVLTAADAIGEKPKKGKRPPQ